MNVFVFDIETVPDINAGRTLHHLEGLDDKQVAAALFALRRQQNRTEFLPLHLQQIVAISVVLRRRDYVKVWSLGEETSDEKDLITRFYSGIDKYTPTLVSWNGSGFDLPVLNYRALLRHVCAPRYWETGDNCQSFRYNNYLSRYHWRHIDLMEVLAAFQPRANAPLDTIATLLGLPGKMGMSGAKVWDTYQAGDIRNIRNYCETDVLNTYLVYLQFEFMREHLSTDALKTEHTLLKNSLIQEEKNTFNRIFNSLGVPLRVPL